MHQFVKAKVKVKIEELVAHTSIPYNIFDESGSQICKAGEKITSRLIAGLCNKDLYRHATMQESAKSAEAVSKISKEASDNLVKLTKTFLIQSQMGNKPPLESFYKARDIIIKETKEQLPKISSVAELRIYYNEYYLSHIINVSILSTALGIKLGLNPGELQDLALASIMHDVGMTRMPDKIINKPGKLTNSEYDLIKLHPRVGYKMLTEEYNIQDKIALVALDHHERFNGSGYPRELSGNDINYFAQIVNVADVFDAATTNKVYAPAKEPKSIIRELLVLSKSFNPSILNTLIYMMDHKM